MDLNKLNPDGIIDAIQYWFWEIIKLPLETFKKIPWHFKIVFLVAFVLLGILMLILIRRHRNDWMKVKY